MKRSHDQVKEEESSLQPKKKEQLIYLNAGGRPLCVRLSVLRDRYPESRFAARFSDSGLTKMLQDNNARYYIDTDGRLFEHILHYMRRGLSFDLVPPQIDREVWFTELAHWGLIIKVKPENPATDQKSLDTMVQEKLELSRQRMDAAIQLLFDLQPESDKIAQGKLRLLFYVPVCGYKTEWGDDLATYIREAELTLRVHLTKTYKYLELCHLDSVSRAMAKIVTYVFNGITYNTRDQDTMGVTLTIRS